MCRAVHFLLIPMVEFSETFRSLLKMESVKLKIPLFIG